MTHTIHHVLGAIWGHITDLASHQAPTLGESLDELADWINGGGNK